MTPRLIAFCSPAPGSGKTTAAEYLVDRHQFIRVSFAAPLKRMTMTLLTSAGIHEASADLYVYGPQSMKETVIPGIGVSARHLMRTLGDEWGRQQVDENLWIKVTMSKVAALLDRGVPVVIDDMRYPNEYQAIVAAGGECRRIVRPGIASTTDHASEGQLDGVQMPEIWNDGDFARLRRQIDALL